MVEDAISFWTDIQRYEDMLAADPTSYCFAPLSELYRKLGLLDDAVSVAQKGCALHPDYPGGFFALGSAYYGKGQRVEARQALEQVVALKPGYLQALKLLGQILVELGEVEEARRVLGEILKQDPDDTESALSLRSIGSGAPSGEEPLEELDVIEDLEEVEPEPARTGLADVARAVGGWDLGAAPSASAVPGAHLQPAQEDDFWAIEAVEELETPETEIPLEEDEGGWGEPASPARPAAQSPGRDPLTTATLAELYVSQGFVEKAVNVYRELLSVDPANHSYRARYAELTESLERQQQAAQPASRPAAATPQAASVESAPGPALAAAPEPAVAAAPEPAAAAAPGPAAAHAAPEPAAREAAPEEITAGPEPVALEAAPQPFAAPAQPQASGAPQDEFEARLCNWLDNIRRRRDGV